MRILVTGARGFMGRNLCLRLAERAEIDVLPFVRGQSQEDLTAALDAADWVVHLAGVNRPEDPTEFMRGNADLTRALCKALALQANQGRFVPVICSSSIQAAQDNPYGRSKLAAEEALFSLHRQCGVPVHIFRLPNVFGKWCKPNYNSAVATFCHNLSRDLPIQIHDPEAPLTLVHIDDVLNRFLQLIDGATPSQDAHGFEQVSPQYATTVGQVASLIQAFRAGRDTLHTERVGTGLVRALYSTYVSYLQPEMFSYPVPMYGDARGVFAEMLKTPDCGQFSYFTAHPGITRGGHYHHAKTEKFLVLQGKARFRFRHMDSGDTYELDTSGDKAVVVETVPGWTHDITNVGSDTMVVMLWANEVFDRNRPDTVACPI